MKSLDRKSVGAYHEATQVGHSRNSKLLPRGPRQQVQAFTLKEDLCVGKAYALANDQYGPGGGTQYYSILRSNPTDNKYCVCGNVSIDVDAGKVGAKNDQLLRVLQIAHADSFEL